MMRRLSLSLDLSAAAQLALSGWKAMRHDGHSRWRAARFVVQAEIAALACIWGMEERKARASLDRLSGRKPPTLLIVRRPRS